MNYKLLFPTYRNRYRFVERTLTEISKEGKPDQALNLGAGEGDYDPMIARAVSSLISCDINARDVAFAKASFGHIPNLTYQEENALETTFSDNTFDLIISCEVIEHVGEPEEMIAEIARILKTGGQLIMTFPRQNFPFTYDPINRWRIRAGKPPISQGAYAFGHEYLINDQDFRTWLDKYGLEIITSRNMSGYLVGLLECYWTGLIQSVLKDNSSNVNTDEESGFKLRPSQSKPWLTFITDMILDLDHLLFKNTKHSIGRGYVVRKK